MRNKNLSIIKKAVNSIVYGKAGSSSHKNNSMLGAKGNKAIPAQITNGDSLTGFTCYLYEDGVDQASTGIATNVMCLDIASSDSACIGEYVYLFENTLTITGGSEE